jgi:hypothetical protein
MLFCCNDEVNPLLFVRHIRSYHAYRGSPNEAAGSLL